METMVIKIRSSANINWLKFLYKLVFKTRTKLRVRALLRITKRFWGIRKKRRGEIGSPYLTPLLLLIQEV